MGSVISDIGSQQLLLSTAGCRMSRVWIRMSVCVRVTYVEQLCVEMSQQLMNLRFLEKP